jgi:hypothetical protein
MEDNLTVPWVPRLTWIGVIIQTCRQHDTNHLKSILELSSPAHLPSADAQSGTNSVPAQIKSKKRLLKSKRWAKPKISQHNLVDKNTLPIIII